MNKEVNIKFRKTLTVTTALKNSEVYNFKFTQEQIDEAKKRTCENPLVVLDSLSDVQLLYSEKGELTLMYFTFCYEFKEGLGEHKLKEQMKNGASCTCGLFFFDKVKKKGIDYLNEHIKKIEALR